MRSGRHKHITAANHAVVGTSRTSSSVGRPSGGQSASPLAHDAPALFTPPRLSSNINTSLASRPAAVRASLLPTVGNSPALAPGVAPPPSPGAASALSSAAAAHSALPAVPSPDRRRSPGSFRSSRRSTPRYAPRFPSANPPGAGPKLPLIRMRGASASASGGSGGATVSGSPGSTDAPVPPISANPSTPHPPQGRARGEASLRKRYGTSPGNGGGGGDEGARGEQASGVDHGPGLSEAVASAGGAIGSSEGTGMTLSKSRSINSNTASLSEWDSHGDMQEHYDDGYGGTGGAGIISQFGVLAPRRGLVNNFHHSEIDSGPLRAFNAIDVDRITATLAAETVASYKVELDSIKALHAEIKHLQRHMTALHKTYGKVCGEVSLKWTKSRTQDLIQRYSFSSDPSQVRVSKMALLEIIASMLAAIAYATGRVADLGISSLPEALSKAGTLADGTDSFGIFSTLAPPPDLRSSRIRPFFSMLRKLHILRRALKTYREQEAETGSALASASRTAEQLREENLLLKQLLTNMASASNTPLERLIRKTRQAATDAGSSRVDPSLLNLITPSTAADDGASLNGTHPSAADASATELEASSHVAVIRGLKADNDALTTVIDSLKRQLASFEVESATLAAEVSVLHKKMSAAGLEQPSSSGSRSPRSESFRETLAALRTRLVDVETEREILLRQLRGAATDDYNALASQLKDAQAEAASAQATIVMLKDKLASSLAMTASAVDLAVSEAEAEARISDDHAHSSRGKRRKHGSHTKGSVSKSRKKSTKKTHSRHRGSSSSRKVASSTARTRRMTADSEGSNATSVPDISEYQAALEEARARISDLEAANQGLKEQLLIAQSDRDAFKAKSNRLEAQVQKLEAKLEALSTGGKKTSRSRGASRRRPSSRASVCSEASDFSDVGSVSSLASAGSDESRASRRGRRKKKGKARSNRSGTVATANPPAALPRSNSAESVRSTCSTRSTRSTASRSGRKKRRAKKSTDGSGLITSATLTELAAVEVESVHSDADASTELTSVVDGGGASRRSRGGKSKRRRKKGKGHHK
ncbi:uncharacterized protein AMSG_04605 [Thecamonas trahens ATCC 50062]|uniref:Uncharacterized protein n=1 Tax=Thecamonas trahens ATCC 50062 TaxID=461836 RepID=A0A0L0D9E2_THETB|nr:hypothetical protein AMSG_04605 [Thecamonas trahens ATCC 50062]KNC48860.1 hypothetical protein AMSG_04605 [Thecamonas trahens ATCC 50062]|eukprot:XP_013758280.1 hypothetical protein AMSG_04605 [Thecamonas trahens ATCC 50062]